MIELLHLTSLKCQILSENVKSQGLPTHLHSEYRRSQSKHVVINKTKQETRNETSYLVN